MSNLGVLDDLETALVDAGDVLLSCLSGDELGVWVLRMQKLRSRMDSLVCSVTAAADAAGTRTIGEAPSRTIGQWVGASSNAETATVARDRTLGVWLRGFDELAEAFAAADLTRRHVEELKKLDTPRTRADLSRDQWYLVAAGRDCAWKDFMRVLGYWVNAADPDGQLPREQDADNRLSLRERADGRVSGTFDLDPLAGAALKTAVRHRAEQMWKADKDRTDEQDGEHHGPPARSKRRRQADALVELVSNGFRRADGSTPKPLVHIVLSPEVAEDWLRRSQHEMLPGDDPERLPLDPEDVDRRCELADGTPIHPAWGVAALTSAVLRRLVMSAESEVLDLGTAVKDFPSHLRDAVIAAHRGCCASPGCDAPVEWLQIDHVIPKARGGPTACWNAQCLCRPENHAKGDSMPLHPPRPPTHDGPP